MVKFYGCLVSFFFIIGCGGGGSNSVDNTPNIDTPIVEEPIVEEPIIDEPIEEAPEPYIYSARFINRNVCGIESPQEDALMVIHSKNGNKATLSPDNEGWINYEGDSKESFTFVNEDSLTNLTTFINVEHDNWESLTNIKETYDEDNCICERYNLVINDPESLLPAELKVNIIGTMGTTNLASKYNEEILPNRRLINNVKVCRKSASEAKTIQAIYTNSSIKAGASYSTSFNLPSVTAQISQDDVINSTIDIQPLDEALFASFDYNIHLNYLALWGENYFVFLGEPSNSNSIDVISVAPKHEIFYKYILNINFASNNVIEQRESRWQDEGIAIEQAEYVMLLDVNSIATNYSAPVQPFVNFFDFHSSFTKTGESYDYSNPLLHHATRPRFYLNTNQFIWTISAPLSGSSSDFDIIDVADTFSFREQELDVFQASYSLWQKLDWVQPDKSSLLVDTGYGVDLDFKSQALHDIYPFLLKHQLSAP